MPVGSSGMRFTRAVAFRTAPLTERTTTRVDKRTLRKISDATGHHRLHGKPFLDLHGKPFLDADAVVARVSTTTAVERHDKGK